MKHKEGKFDKALKEDIRVFKSQVSTIEYLDESKILKSFIQFGYPYKDQILKKDEEFFLKTGSVNVENDYMSESIHLRDLWKNKLSPKNKEVVWKYFQVMIVLADKYLAK